MESSSRLLFALAVAVGIAEGQSAVAVGMAAAPLRVARGGPARLRPPPAREPRARAGGDGPRAGARRPLRARRAGHHARRADAAERGGADDGPDRRRRRGRRLRVQRPADRARAAAALPGGPGLAPAPPRRARGEGRRGRRRTAPCASRCWPSRASRWRSPPGSCWSARGRWASCSTTGRTTAASGLALVGLGMGFHLMSGTLNQAALAREQGGRAAVAWLVASALFVAWLVAPRRRRSAAARRDAATSGPRRSCARCSP